MQTLLIFFSVREARIKQPINLNKQKTLLNFICLTLGMKIKQPLFCELWSCLEDYIKLFQL